MTDERVAVRRSPLHEVVEHLHPAWTQIHGMPSPIHFGNAAGEALQAQTLGLCDVSAFPRIGFKGKGAEAWLSSRGIKTPAKIYRPLQIENDRGTILRTGSSEMLIEDGIDGSTVATLWREPDSSLGNVTRFRRCDAVMYLGGIRAIDVFAETCGYDFFDPDAAFIYTRIAGVSCGILTIERYKCTVYQIWCDGSFGSYLWEQLYEISREHGGAAVGLAAFFPSLMT